MEENQRPNLWDLVKKSEREERERIRQELEPAFQNRRKVDIRYTKDGTPRVYDPKTNEDITSTSDRNATISIPFTSINYGYLIELSIQRVAEHNHQILPFKNNVWKKIMNWVRRKDPNKDVLVENRKTLVNESYAHETAHAKMAHKHTPLIYYKVEFFEDIRTKRAFLRPYLNWKPEKNDRVTRNAVTMAPLTLGLQLSQGDHDNLNS